MIAREHLVEINEAPDIHTAVGVADWLSQTDHDTVWNQPEYLQAWRESELTPAQFKHCIDQRLRQLANKGVENAR